MCANCVFLISISYSSIINVPPKMPDSTQQNIGYYRKQSTEQVRCLDLGLYLDLDLDPGLCQACNK